MNRDTHLKTIVLAMFFWVLASWMPSALAQQTIFNVPSADVTPKGHLYEEHESQFRPWNPDSFWNLTHYNALGVGHRTEVDVTLLNVSAPASHKVSLGLGFKSYVPLLVKKYREREFKLTYGELIPIALQRQGQDIGHWEYSHLSGRLPKLNTRLTAGVSNGSDLIFGRNVVCFIGGYEHPVTKKFSLIGDWFSGTHNLGFFIPGFSYSLPKDYVLFLGYQIPNTARCGHSGIVFEVSRVF